MKAKLGHDDERGEACAHHLPPRLDAILQLALVGTRSTTFNHDCASKLQGLMMALDDLTELDDPRARSAVETALTASKELHHLLNGVRALAKAGGTNAIKLRDIVLPAADRMRVTLRGGALPDVEVEVAASQTSQALSLAFDVAAGPGRSRELPFAHAVEDRAVRLELSCAEAPASAGDLLAIAAFTFARDGGALSCAPSSIVIRLPRA